MKNIPPKKTTEEYRKILKTQHPNIQLIGSYNGSRKSAHYKCLICGHEWDCQPDSLKNTKYGCKICAKKITSSKLRKSHDVFVKQLKTVNENIIVLSKYTNSQTKVKCKCKIDGYEWDATPAHLLGGKGCPKCGGSLKLTNTEFLIRVEQANPYIQPLEEYINNGTPILAQCKRCGHQWKIDPDHIYRGGQCPACNMSKGEANVFNWLTQNHINFKFQYKFPDCKNINPLPFDFYLPDFNMCIEYDGEQHFKPIIYQKQTNEERIRNFERRQKHDLIKTNFCKDNNIELLRIPYWDFNNINKILENKFN